MEDIYKGKDGPAKRTPVKTRADIVEGRPLYEEFRHRQLNKWFKKASAWFNKSADDKLKDLQAAKAVKDQLLRERAERIANGEMLDSDAATTAAAVEEEEEEDEDDIDKEPKPPRQFFGNSYTFTPPARETKKTKIDDGTGKQQDVDPLNPDNDNDESQQQQQQQQSGNLNVNPAKPVYNGSIETTPAEFNRHTPLELMKIRKVLEARGYVYKEFKIYDYKGKRVQVDAKRFGDKIVNNNTLANFLLTLKPFSQKESGSYGIHIELNHSVYVVKNGDRETETILSSNSAIGEEFVIYDPYALLPTTQPSTTQSGGTKNDDDEIENGDYESQPINGATNGIVNNTNQPGTDDGSPTEEEMEQLLKQQEEEGQNGIQGLGF